MKRQMVGQFPQLNIDKLSRQGFLVPGTQFDWGWNVPSIEQGNILIQVQESHLTLRYLYGLEPGETLMTEQIPLVSGKKRTWFGCPKCQRAVAILYGVNGLFFCRKCHRLVYPSQYPCSLDGEGKKYGSQ
ncbi:MAG: hypothetical protein KC643_33630 [Nitrospira sp.]|nr:hypothetical protein [Nitrospira sp.]MCA9498567.1 hypothetical protein [Nitrospira sp.]